MTSMRLVHRISDVACVELDVTRRSDTQPDYSKFISGVGMKHPEVIRRNLVDRVNAIFEERQQQFTVLQQSRWLTSAWKSVTQDWPSSVRFKRRDSASSLMLCIRF